ncbi:DUF1653 domain-containing protein [bacterium]|nr:DUF1653 domain-containing protein [bacterium]
MTMPKLSIPGVYRHYKGDLYLLEFTATDTETGETMVIYRGLYDPTKYWCRPLKMFSEVVNQGGQVHRFEQQRIVSQHQH